MGRMFDRILECGCMYSSDGGGALMQCCYPGYGAKQEDIDKCNKAHKKWHKTKDYIEYMQECRRGNSSTRNYVL